MHSEGNAAHKLWKQALPPNFHCQHEILIKEKKTNSKNKGRVTQWQYIIGYCTFNRFYLMRFNKTTCNISVWYKTLKPLTVLTRWHVLSKITATDETYTSNERGATVSRIRAGTEGMTHTWLYHRPRFGTKRDLTSGRHSIS